MSPIGNRIMRGPSLDKLERMHISDMPSGGLNLETIGVEAAQVTERMPLELVFYTPTKFHDHEKSEPRPPIMPLEPLTR